MVVTSLFKSKGRAVVCAGLAIALAAGPVVALADAAADSPAPAVSAGGLTTPTPATLTEDQLDTVVGVYTYDGESHEITAREAIEDATGLDAALNADGTYNAPSADSILTYVRNKILADIVAEQGVEVSDEEVAAYALQSIGTDDIATIAQYYGMDEEQAARILKEGAAVVKLRDQVVGVAGEVPAAPMAPNSAEDADTPTEEYAAYVLNLLGDAWDAASGTWAATDSPFYQALSPYEFDGATATYEMAQIAYYVAYSLAQQEANAQLAEWQAYVNQYLGNASVAIYTLRS